MSQGHHAATEPSSKPATGAARPARYPLAAFPPSFTDELERYLRLLADPGNGTDRVYPPSTIGQRRLELRLAAARLAEHWGGVDRVNSLAILVEPANTQTILEAYRRRTDNGKPTDFMRTLTKTLIALARDWVKATPEALAQLIAMQRKMGTTPNSLTAKTRRLLQDFGDPQVRDALLALPATMAARAQRPRLAPQRRRQQWRTAVAIELLLHTGLRLHQLATLRVDEHLTWPDGKEGPLRVCSPGRKTPDGARQEYELVGAPRALLHDYLDRYGPKVSRQRPLLFVNANGTPVTESALADGIHKATLRGAGLRVTPSQFPHLCATLLLAAFPGEYTTVKDLLGHRFLETTLAFYGGQEREALVGQWNASLAQERAQLPAPKDRHVQ